MVDLDVLLPAGFALGFDGSTARIVLSRARRHRDGDWSDVEVAWIDIQAVDNRYSLGRWLDEVYRRLGVRP